MWNWSRWPFFMFLSVHLILCPLNLSMHVDASGRKSTVVVTLVNSFTHTATPLNLLRPQRHSWSITEWAGHISGFVPICPFSFSVPTWMFSRSPSLFSSSPPFLYSLLQFYPESTSNFLEVADIFWMYLFMHNATCACLPFLPLFIYFLLHVFMLLFWSFFCL